jgi:adenosylcobinamide kinase/adenosylcobinamide-phosphate guanylyltransferase
VLPSHGRSHWFNPSTAYHRISGSGYIFPEPFPFLETTQEQLRLELMPTSILITGGCRSGKSSQALRIASMLEKKPQFFIATCRPEDDEMQARVKRHRKERGSQWFTLETPVEVAQAILQHGGSAGVMVIDCLTLWISNLMAIFPDDQPILNRIEALGQLLSQPLCHLIVVSNEVGCGIVPANSISRRFRDLVGWANQRLAHQCLQVIWMVAGIPVPIKPSPPFKGLGYPAGD